MMRSKRKYHVLDVRATTTPDARDFTSVAACDKPGGLSVELADAKLVKLRVLTLDNGAQGAVYIDACEEEVTLVTPSDVCTNCLKAIGAR